MANSNLYKVLSGLTECISGLNDKINDNINGSFPNLSAGYATNAGTAENANTAVKTSKAIVFTGSSGENLTFDGSLEGTIKPGNKIVFIKSGNEIEISHSGNYSEISNKLKKISVDNTGHITSTSDVIGEDLPTHTHNKSEILDLENVLIFKGTALESEILAKTGSIGDFWKSSDTNKKYVCLQNGVFWEEFGTTSSGSSLNISLISSYVQDKDGNTVDAPTNQNLLTLINDIETTLNSIDNMMAQASI